MRRWTRKQPFKSFFERVLKQRFQHPLFCPLPSCFPRYCLTRARYFFLYLPKLCQQNKPSTNQLHLLKMSETSTDTSLPFLKGGGEMGRLTRAKDWSNTPVGLPKSWPQSLKTTLSILLNSRFPMFLMWGPDLVCFYNDAYRPSLGQHGKHPSILGMTAQQAWPEIWKDIEPLIAQVLAGGGATWSEDQLTPYFSEWQDRGCVLDIQL